MKAKIEERTYKQLPESMVVKQSDDAWHPLKNKNYVEWWYFDLINSDGTLVRGHFLIAGDITKPGKVRAVVRASYVKTDGTETLIEQRFPFSEFKASTEACDVKIGKNFIRGDLSHYKLHIEDGDNVLDLTLDSKMSGITAFAYFGDETKCMYWVVPQPRSQAKGTFRTNGKTLNIEGVGYRDHNWLNFTPLGRIAYWDWGRIYDKEYTIIFANIVTTKRLNNAEIKPLLVFDSKKLVLLSAESQKWSLTKKEISFEPSVNMALPRRHILKANDEGLSLEINLELQRVFQRIDPLADINPLLRFLIRTLWAKPMAISYFSSGAGKLHLSGKENALNCTVIHELVKSNK